MAVLTRAPTMHTPRGPLPPPVVSRLDSLTGLRFFAAFLVVSHHVAGVYAPIPALRIVTDFGASGVLFFFVLSGFVLTWAWRDGDRPRDFYWRRFARVWPLHMALLIPALHVTGAFASGRSSLAGVTLSVPLLQAWVPGLYFSGNPVSWSLSCELFFYLLFPLVIPQAAALAGRRLAAALCGVLALMLLGALSIHVFFEGALAAYLVNVSPPYRFLQFLFGVLLAVALRRGSLPAVPLWAGFALVAACPFVLPLAATQGFTWYYTLATQLRWPLWPLAYGLLIVAAAQSDIRRGSTPLSGKPLVLLGQWSFALYLVHLLVILKALQLGGRRPPSQANIIDLIGITTVSVALSAVLFTVVERPVERWLRARAPGALKRRASLAKRG